MAQNGLRSICGSAVILMAWFSTQRVLADTKPSIEMPPLEVIEAAFHTPPPPARAVLKKPDPSPPAPLCGLLPADLDVSRGDHTRTYKVLVDMPRDESLYPTKFFLRVSRLTVDADGSSRAFHPDDPLGVGVCKPGKQKACALDKLPNADVGVFRGTSQIKPKETAKKSTEYLATWADAWSRISKNPNASLNRQSDPRIPEGVALYYFKDANLTVVFKTAIIPFLDGAPCMRGPKLTDPGYFVTATSFKKTNVKSQSICDPTQYLDASKASFVVVPGDTFGNVHIGDIAVGFAEPSAGRKPVFGIVGDKGPPFKTAEASIAFNSQLVGRKTPLINSTQQKDIDIDLEGNITGMGILVLGGSAAALKGDFSAGNIARIGNRLLNRWSPGRDPTKRLEACLKAAPLNSWREETKK